MKLFRKTLLTLLLAFSLQSAIAQITEKPGFGKFAITNATVHTVTNGVIENGTVLIDGNLISYVGTEATYDNSYTVIDAAGKHVYPGLMDAQTSLGLVEISAVDRTVDNQEVGDMNPHVLAFTAINPHSASIPVTRVNGVTHVISLPTGNGIAGKATLIDLWGYSPDSMAVLKEAGLHVAWPSSGRRGWWDQRSEKEIKEAYDKTIEMLNEYWDKAIFYDEMMTAFEAESKGKEHPDKDLRMEAMRNVVNGEIPIIVSVNGEKDILNALKWISEVENARFILNGVREGWRVADEIAEAGIPVITTTLYTPTRSYDNYQRPYQNPGLMAEAGVKVLLASGDTENVRNLPYNAGYAATYGMGTEEALKAVTINPAEAFGVADKLGSLEAGKHASLIITDGDPFEPLTNIEQVFIRGYQIPMVSRHTQLFQEFLDRDAVNE